MIEELQLLIPRCYREKQVKAAEKRYSRTIILVQFPDRGVLQGVFGPWEQTTALYEVCKYSYAIEILLVHIFFNRVSCT